ncbi:helix-turn-helix domain-containing protein [Sinomicrobium sp.]
MITGERTHSENLLPYVNDILVFEEKNQNAETVLPFFADGFPGIVFNVAPNGLYLQHKNKRLSDFFLYGQTINPIELSVKGTYKLIAFQIFPFAVRVLLGVEPKILNDDCFDLTGFIEQNQQLKNLKKAETTKRQIKIISLFLEEIAKNSSLNPDKSILLAINLIVQFKGKISVSELRNKLFLTERTLERRFVKEVGVTPKVFCKIIQFQNSLAQIKNEASNSLTGIAYENGFSDQSHFIKTFKKYTGFTPSEFQHLPALANFIPE